MTTPDPALDAALDRYGMESELLGMWGERNHLDPRYQRQRERIKAARAAVVACAAPARARVEALEDVAKTAQWMLDNPVDEDRLRETLAALASLDGEPEDAGAGEADE